MNWLDRLAVETQDGNLLRSRSYGMPLRMVQLFRLRKRITIVFTAVLLLAAIPQCLADQTVRMVAFGDSLVSGYGLPANDAFSAQLEAALQGKGLNVAVVNAGVSGDTSTGGLGRLDWSIPEGTDAVIMVLGANDALRGIDPKVTRNALTTIVARLKARKIEILLCGMLAPRNMGQNYAAAYDAIFTDLAKDNGLLFYPFFLDGIAFDPKFTLSDGIHPNAAGIAEIVARILPKTGELLARVRAKRGS